MPELPDLRKLRGVWLAPSDDDVARVMGRQGPDALSLDLRGFREALRGRKGRLKPTLMNQAVIAGLGNLLVDEVCWQARLHPCRPVAGLDDELRLCTPRCDACCARRCGTHGCPACRGG